MTTRQICDVIEERYALQPGTLREDHSGSWDVLRPRQIAMYLVHARSSRSYRSIGRAFGGYTHSTVIHACRRVQVWMEQQTEIREAVADLNRRIDRG